MTRRVNTRFTLDEVGLVTTLTHVPANALTCEVGGGTGVFVNVSVGGMVAVNVSVGMSMVAVAVSRSGAGVSLITVGDGIGWVVGNRNGVGEGGKIYGRTFGIIVINAAQIVTIAPMIATMIVGLKPCFLSLMSTSLYE